MLATSGPALSQSREFFCGEESVVKLKVIDKKTISAGPIDGRTIALRQVPEKPMTYSNGKTSIEIGRDQKRITISFVDSESIGCVYPIPAGVAGSSDAMASAEAGSPVGNGTRKPVATPKPTGTDAVAAADLSDNGAKGFPAMSIGGAVRSGPGMDFKQIASLKNGERLSIIAYSTVQMDGYEWFKIRFGGKKIGYQWGGIVCPIGKQIPGAFQSC